MSPRLYFLVWFAVAVSAGVLWLLGSFTLTVGVVFGFIAFGLTFAGMMNVLPIMVSHQNHPDEPAPIKVKAVKVPHRTATVRARMA